MPNELSSEDENRVCDAGSVIEIACNEAYSPESATEAEEVIITFQDGTELLIYIYEGHLKVEVD